MEENKLKTHLKKLKADLAPMSWRQRLEHLWTYYKWVLAVLVFLGFLLQIIITSATNANTEILISGIGINVPLTDQGITCLSDGYFEQLGGKKGQAVQYIEEILDTDNQTTALEMGYTAVVKVSGLTSLGELDYLLMDTEALEYYSEGDLFMDLRQVFTDEELARLNVTAIGDVPMLIDLSGTWFADNYITGEGPYYLAFIYNTTRTQQCYDLWLYLNSGK